MIAYSSRQARPSAGGRLRARRGMDGLSLIEILVSVVILGIGLLGVAAMQSLALRGGQSSLEASQVVMQSNAIIEAMRANRADAAAYNTAGMVCAAGAGGTLAQNDLANWITSLKANVSGPAAGDDVTTCGQITGCPDACEVTIRWDDSRAGGDDEREFATRTRI
ncbi:type IV pilus modification PilV family protein [Luteimonas kalidii]|uniref:Prepilin-type N-terminal cleavage/methylation domain-containing protein n=1 Tax=Luteimonas kalidii TaxID=3042025 RepID=A0ABT6JZ39_9GAMM|nr:prepilin-type N-terminal cleavage/methylation domain-containing protein [Luteimonas kalidii]MDH5835546.1 prepilin-type N-terminal cleavage/methylation domain-containing protein [Luteimonas kalidii]